MSKYDPLWAHVREAAPSVLTFAQIQAVCGFPIDHSFLRYKKELEPYGFRVVKISLKEQTVRFEKLG